MVKDRQRKWHVFDAGSTIGQRVMEDGIVIRDEEHPDGARITIGHGGDVAPYAITMGIYVWTFYSCFYKKESDAQKTFEEMKPDIEIILELTQKDGTEIEERNRLVGNAISKS